MLSVRFLIGSEPLGILNDASPTSTTPSPLTENDTNWIFDIVNNSAKLRTFLKALLIDDLKRRNENGNEDVKEILGTSTSDDAFLPKADRSTQETTEGEETELSPEQMDFFGDGI